MPTHRPRQIDRHTVERLLAGEVPAGTRDGPDPLIDHLAALAAPARSDEIADEPEATEAFRAETQIHATLDKRPRSVGWSPRAPPCRGASTTSSASSVSATEVCGRTCAPTSTTWPARQALREIGSL